MDLTQLIYSILSMLVFLLFLTVMRSNSLKEETNMHLKTFNKNFKTFKDKEAMTKIVSDLNDKVNKLVTKINCDE